MKIKVPYLSRLEGHAHLVVDAAAGEVVDCRLEVVETPRFFEKILVGRHYSEVAGLAARICGVCSHSHNLVSLQATESAFGLRVSDQTVSLRRLLMYGEIIQSHLVHLFFMALPDYLGVNSLLALAGKKRELVARALRLKSVGSEICTLVGGRPVHPVTTCVGGFRNLPEPGALRELRRRLSRSLPDLEQTVELVAGLDWPEYSREVCCLALNDPAGGYPLFGAELVTTDGTRLPVSSYRELIEEYVVPHSTAKHARCPSSYQVGPLARFRQGFLHLSPLASEVAGLLELDDSVRNPYLAQGVRLVEVLHCVEQAMRQIDKLLLEGLQPEAPASPAGGGQGVAALEAPRGMLLHAYRYDASGHLEAADCVIPTAQNLACIEADLRARTPQIIHQTPELFQADLERLVRAYDPCLSCSTHLLTVERI